MGISEISYTVNGTATSGTSESISDGLKDAQEDRGMAEGLERIHCMNRFLRCLYEGTHDEGARILLGRNFKDPQWGGEEQTHPVLPEQSDIASIRPPGNDIESDVGTCEGQDEVSSFSARAKLSCLTSRNDVRVPQGSRPIVAKFLTKARQGKKLPARSMPRWKMCLYLAKPAR
jgi:hypothetical protein